MSIFNTPPSTTDPLKLLQFFQEKRDASKGGVNGIMSDTNSNTDVDDFVASTYEALNNRRMLAMEEVAGERNSVLASYTAPVEASTISDSLEMASYTPEVDKDSEITKLIESLITESYGEENDSVTKFSPEGTGVFDNATLTDGNSAGEVVEPVVEEVSTTGDGIMSSLRPKARPTSLNDNDDIINFIKNLTMSESSGNPDAEITIKDGRTFAGLLQFGEKRLTDYKMETGKKFTQKQFKKDLILQQEVALWHIKDIDKYIDSIKNKGIYTNRDGLRAVAHLGGKTGMRDFVKTKGKYNPKDELGTSLQDYYNKYSKTKVANNSLMAKTTPSETPTSAIKVKKGQTLSDIAKANNTTVAKLKEANTIEDINKINVGQSISIPKP